MSILTDADIQAARREGKIEIEPFDRPDCLQPASYDMRLGKRAIITRSVSLGELKGKVERQEVDEVDVEAKRTITVPAGGFALVSTLERIKLGNDYVGHIGLCSYYARKGLSLLSGLQIDPGWNGHLVLGLCNPSPRSLLLEYGDPICTIELHQLNRPAENSYAGPYASAQKEGRIPREDRDYLRTIETMSVSDLTSALMSLSQSVDRLSREFWLFLIPLSLAVIGIIVAALK